MSLFKPYKYLIYLALLCMGFIALSSISIIFIENTNKEKIIWIQKLLQENICNIEAINTLVSISSTIGFLKGVLVMALIMILSILIALWKSKWW